jgi:hypothetical protein
MKDDVWTLNNAALFCTLLEAIAPSYGFHVALTGGCLYKDGPRKDCDVILYRIRTDGQPSTTPVEELLKAFKTKIGISRLTDHGFVVKAEYEGRQVDFLIPESEPTEVDYAGNHGG